ncbi:hypothetical protein FD755_019538 [Muntiacus reevesi]|uniref:Pre-rRNA-processing protein Ipi1 N-terminal domain-containing protein n=1 Tax=Muntiacus reevesi TaxID=9886 RepID=A0A5N3X4D6_MUNRE|nr:hypothetical protein FD755_019538 [Muntiacus reevesi]
MTKKRKRQDDFQKVKLKVGKKKPRSENATLTNFKTKTIHLPEQLKEDVTLPTNNRKLNIKDLLSQMHHYNAGVKQSALLGLRDLLSQHPYMLDAHLSHILSEVAAVFTDKDAAVRSAAVQLLRSLAPHIRAEQISPLFPLVSAHLSSAMTHIAEGVQEDALRVLDVLLEQYPALLTDRSSILLKNFVELISHQRPSRGLVNRHRSQSWILSVNPNRRLTSQQWRLKVLVSLSKFLQALTDGSSRLRESEGLQEQKENPHATSNSIFINWKEHASDQQHIQVYENGGSQPNVSSQFRLRYLVGGLGTVDEGLSSTENLKGFIEIIIPLLIECWIEAVPPQLAASVGNGIEREPLQVMQQVLNIISLLWKLSKQHDETHKLESWLRKNYLIDFKHHFMSNFPYALKEITKQKRKETNKSIKHCTILSNNVDHLLLNLTLSDIMVSLANASTLQKDSSWIERIREFVTEALEDGSRLNSKQLNRLLGVSWRLMQMYSRLLGRSILSQLFVLHEQIFPVSESFPDLEEETSLYDTGSLHTREAICQYISQLLMYLPSAIAFSLIGIHPTDLLSYWSGWPKEKVRNQNKLYIRISTDYFLDLLRIQMMQKVPKFEVKKIPPVLPSNRGDNNGSKFLPHSLHLLLSFLFLLKYFKSKSQRNSLAAPAPEVCTSRCTADGTLKQTGVLPLPLFIHRLASTLWRILPLVFWSVINICLLQELVRFFWLSNFLKCSNAYLHLFGFAVVI